MTLYRCTIALVVPMTPVALYLMGMALYGVGMALRTLYRVVGGVYPVPVSLVGGDGVGLRADPRIGMGVTGLYRVVGEVLTLVAVGLSPPSPVALYRVVGMGLGAFSAAGTGSAAGQAAVRAKGIPLDPVGGGRSRGIGYWGEWVSVGGLESGQRITVLAPAGIVLTAVSTSLVLPLATLHGTEASLAFIVDGDKWIAVP